ncbi:hypothetical protein CRG98_008008 [Punica granatum]|uniref:Uncharacterized protein n=1 Tax=Punica granatum TaxID=22663 RepID=A0A2I0KTE2_PUNGR|nr:hypothetical protein CRG98_008008 [Punica granatum]
MLDDLRLVLGGDGPIAMFTGDAVVCECCHREVVLWVGLTLGTKSHLVSRNEWEPHEAHPQRWKPALLLGLLPVGLLETGLVAGVFVVCRTCPNLAMRDSSSEVERLHTLRNWESESTVVYPLAVPVILTSLSLCFGEANRVSLLEALMQGLRAPVGHAWAYRDVLKDTTTALLVVRHARRLRTLLVKCRCFVRSLSLIVSSDSPSGCLLESGGGLGASLDLNGDACGDVEWFVRSSLSSTSKGGTIVAVDYAVRNMEWTHEKIFFVLRATHGVPHMRDTQFWESGHYHNRVVRP